MGVENAILEPPLNAQLGSYLANRGDFGILQASLSRSSDYWVATSALMMGKRHSGRLLK